MRSGPLGQNAVPAQIPGPGGHPIPFNPLKHVAFNALDHAYSIGYLVCAGAAALAFVLAAVALRGHGEAREPVEEPEAEPAVH